jgi:hypothetical protein
MFSIITIFHKKTKRGKETQNISGVESIRDNHHRFQFGLFLLRLSDCCGGVQNLQLQLIAFPPHTISPSKTVIYSYTFFIIMIHSTMKSSTREKENDRSLSSHILTLHRRLLHALNLGTRSPLSLSLSLSQFAFRLFFSLFRFPQLI